MKFHCQYFPPIFRTMESSNFRKNTSKQIFTFVLKDSNSGWCYCSAINITEKRTNSRQKTVYQHFPSALVSGYSKMRKNSCRYLLPYQRSIPFNWRYCIPTVTLPRILSNFSFSLCTSPEYWSRELKVWTCILSNVKSFWNFMNALEIALFVEILTAVESQVCCFYQNLLNNFFNVFLIFKLSFRAAFA